MKYYVTVDGDTREVELTEEGLQLDGRPIHAELASVPGSAEGHLRLGDRGYPLTGHRVEGGWTIEIAGRKLRLGVEDERARAIRELAGEAASSPSTRDLRAPMPGLVVRVLVDPGQVVSAGTGLVVVEAMKMENELVAETDSTVSSVEIQEGATVNQNDLLVTFTREDET